jgi:hypothetical protein
MGTKDIREAVKAKLGFDPPGDARTITTTVLRNGTGEISRFKANGTRQPR